MMLNPKTRRKYVLFFAEWRPPLSHAAIGELVGISHQRVGQIFRSAGVSKPRAERKRIAPSYGEPPWAWRARAMAYQGVFRGKIAKWAGVYRGTLEPLLAGIPMQVQTNNYASLRGPDILIVLEREGLGLDAQAARLGCSRMGILKARMRHGLARRGSSFWLAQRWKRKEKGNGQGTSA